MANKPDIQMIDEICGRLGMTWDERNEFHDYLHKEFLGSSAEMKFNQLVRIAQDWLENRRRIMGGGWR